MRTVDAGTLMLSGWIAIGFSRRKVYTFNGMINITLDGKWTLRKDGDREIVPARVPGCVHTDLLRAGKIPDPYVRDNEKRLQWIGKAGWTYSREFTVPAGLLDHDRVLLVCEMLDTLATVTINGHTAGKSDNMFRTWEFDVKKLLRPGRNTISVRFDSPFPYMEKKQGKRRMQTGEWIRLDGSPWIRKEPCNFGWDWGPQLVTAGIQRPIRLVAFSQARITDVHVTQKHVPGHPVVLDVEVNVECPGSGEAVVSVGLWMKGSPRAGGVAMIDHGKGRIRILVQDPELWWPAGMGSQPLYDLVVDLIGADGRLDSSRKRIGLRTLKLDEKKDRWGRSFRFVANGVPFFGKGADWIPADTFQSRVTEADFRRLLTDARDANMNMIRVWGGGVYENDVFYDIADELGLCIWQDFMFACNPYPSFDAGFMASVRAEAEDNIRRIRHHACLALWCGNNEMEWFCIADKWTNNRMSRSDYLKLFDVLLPDAVRRCDPGRDYIPSSPYSPDERKNPDNPGNGDAHLWGVWHGRKPYEWYRTCLHRFISEFGFQSFPEPRTVRGITAPQDRNVTSPVMEHHQRSGIGNTLIMQYMLEWFRVPKNFESTLWLSQILQALAIKYGVEHWRRNMPRVMGAIYWQLNDCWQVASWASIDWHGRWKALHWAAKKFFAPVLVSGVEDVKKGTVEVHVTTDLLKTVSGVLRWTATNSAGKRLASGSKKIRAVANGDTVVERLALKKLIDRNGPADVLVWLELSVAGRLVSDNLVYFSRPKQMNLGDPGIRTAITRARDGAFRVKLVARKVALWTWLELGSDARYSDNFIHLRPGRAVTVEVKPLKTMAADRFRRVLRVHSLVQTFR
jgi:beta-mannosidase